MKSDKKILLAFILNLFFAVFEVLGGVFTGSVAILSDALHDLGDAASIGISFFLEKKSKKQPSKTHTYGYARYSVLGSVITGSILLFGSVAIICSAVNRLVNPIPIRYDGMIVLAVIGAAVNFCAAFFTRGGSSLNQRAVNLHMLEDVFGWIVVLIGAVFMHFTHINALDAVLSIGVAVFILICAVKNLKAALDLFLVKTPRGICVDRLRDDLLSVEGVSDVHHLHVWSLDGEKSYATLHIVTDGDLVSVKKKVRAKLYESNIFHATVETESPDEICTEKHCRADVVCACASHSHHHHG